LPADTVAVVGLNPIVKLPDPAAAIAKLTVAECVKLPLVPVIVRL
jgi:hypothetical protein